MWRRSSVWRTPLNPARQVRACGDERQAAVAAEALEKSVLEGKDREQLMAIAQALGVKSVSRAKKAELIERILEQTATPEPAKKAAPKAEAPAPKAAAPAKTGTANSEPKEQRVVIGADGEPLSEWELELAEHEGTLEETASAGHQRNPQRNDRNREGGQRDGQRNDGPRNDGQRRDFGQQRRDFDGEGGGRNRRRRRRNKNRRDDFSPQGDDRYEVESVVEGEPVSTEPVAVKGYLDLRDEGYGFLRVN